MLSLNLAARVCVVALLAGSVAAAPAVARQHEPKCVKAQTHKLKCRKSAPKPTPAPSPAPAPSGGKTTTVNVTFYGAADNDPAGSTEIAHPVIHDGAGGTGTFKDPLTFASGGSSYAYGQKIYVPRLQRYFIREDDCASCSGAWVDLYVGNPSMGSGVVSCENHLTIGSESIIVDPPAGLAVKAGALCTS